RAEATASEDGSANDARPAAGESGTAALPAGTAAVDQNRSLRGGTAGVVGPGWWSGSRASERSVLSVAPANSAWMSASDRPSACSPCDRQRLQRGPWGARRGRPRLGAGRAPRADGGAPRDPPPVGHAPPPPAGRPWVVDRQRGPDLLGELVKRPQPLAVHTA